jgi:hypothetical protein
MKTRNVILLLAMLAIGACSSMKHREPDEQVLARYMDNAGPPIDRFSYLGRFDSWRALARDKVVVWTGINDAYLLTVDSPCHNLQFTSSIGLTNSTGTVTRGFDSVTVGTEERCRINEIRKIDYKKVREIERAGG